MGAHSVFHAVFHPIVRSSKLLHIHRPVLRLLQPVLSKRQASAAHSCGMLMLHNGPSAAVESTAQIARQAREDLRTDSYGPDFCSWRKDRANGTSQGVKAASRYGACTHPCIPIPALGHHNPSSRARMQRHQGWILWSLVLRFILAFDLWVDGVRVDVCLLISQG